MHAEPSRDMRLRLDYVYHGNADGEWMHLPTLACVVVLLFGFTLGRSDLSNCYKLYTVVPTRTGVAN